MYNITITEVFHPSIVLLVTWLFITACELRKHFHLHFISNTIFLQKYMKVERIGKFINVAFNDETLQCQLSPVITAFYQLTYKDYFLYQMQLICSISIIMYTKLKNLY